MDKEYLEDVKNDISYDINDIAEDIDSLKDIALDEIVDEIKKIVGRLKRMNADFNNFADNALLMIKDEVEE